MLRPQPRLPSALPTLIQEWSPWNVIYARCRASTAIRNIWRLCFPFDTPNFSPFNFSRDINGFVYSTDNRQGVCVNLREILYSTRLLFWRVPVISCVEKYLKRQLTVCVFLFWLNLIVKLRLCDFLGDLELFRLNVCVDGGTILRPVYISIKRSEIFVM